MMQKFNEKFGIIDESWIERLWKWADENDVGDLEWIKAEYYDEDGYYTGLPRDKKSLLALKELNLRSNQLTELPKEIWNLSNLTKLVLKYNQLTELPKEIGSLRNLTTLNLGVNQLTELPKEIRNLRNLTTLNLEHNQLTELPKEIWYFRNLTTLNLWGNPNLILTQEQKEWIKRLKENVYGVFIDDDLLDRNINYDEIPF